MQFFTLYSAKNKVSKTYFFDIVATHNDHPTYVKHVLCNIYVFFSLLGGLRVHGTFSVRWTCNRIFQNSTFSETCWSPMAWVWVIIW